jgi:antitoxin HicB
MKVRFDHSGSSFDSFLEEEGVREEVEAVAIKRVIAWQLEQAMKRQQKTKLALARELRTSRTQLDRLLDPANTSVSLATLARAAHALGKRMTIRLTAVKANRKQPAPAESRQPLYTATKAEAAAIGKGRAAYRRGDFTSLDQLHKELEAARRQPRKKVTRKAS